MKRDGKVRVQKAIYQTREEDTQKEELVTRVAHARLRTLPVFTSREGLRDPKATAVIW